MANLAMAIFGGLGQGASGLADMYAKERLLQLQNKYGLDEYKKKKDIDLAADEAKTNRIRDAIKSRLNPVSQIPAASQESLSSILGVPQKIGNGGISKENLEAKPNVPFQTYDPQTGTFKQGGTIPNPRVVNSEIYASPAALQNPQVMDQLNQGAQLAQQYKNNPDNFPEAVQNQGLPASKSERALQVAMMGESQAQPQQLKQSAPQAPGQIDANSEYNKFINDNIDLYAATGNIASIYDDATAHVNNLYSRRNSDLTYQKGLKELSDQSAINQFTGGIPLELYKLKREDMEVSGTKDAFKAVAAERGLPPTQIEALLKTKNPFQELARLTGMDRAEEGLGMRRELLPLQKDALRTTIQGGGIRNQYAPALIESQINRNNLADDPRYRTTVNADGEVTQSVNSFNPNTPVPGQKKDTSLRDTLAAKIDALGKKKYKAGK